MKVRLVRRLRGRSSGWRSSPTAVPPGRPVAFDRSGRGERTAYESRRWRALAIWRDRGGSTYPHPTPRPHGRERVAVSTDLRIVSTPAATMDDVIERMTAIDAA